MKIIKCEFHCHSKEDPMDHLNHSATQLIDKAAAEGFGFVALTLHRKVYLPTELAAYAATRGILMVPSAELSIQGKDVLAINCPKDLPERLQTMDDLRRFKNSGEAAKCLIIAPHPHYVFGGSLGGKLLAKYSDCFDAVELCHFHTRWLDRGKPAKKFARNHDKPVIATSDAHSLHSFGRCFCEVEVSNREEQPIDWEDILHAILINRIRNHRPPMSSKEFLWGARYLIQYDILNKLGLKHNYNP